MINRTKPTLNLPFASMGQENANNAFQNMGGVVTNSNGTRINEKGLIETVPDNTLRVDYDSVTGECKGLLVEEERTNLVRSSEDFSGNWAVEGNSSATTEDDFFLKRHTSPLASGQNRIRQKIGYGSDVIGRSFILSIILPPKSYFSDPTAGITVGVLSNDLTSMVVTPSDYYKKFSLLVEPTGSSTTDMIVFVASQSTDLSLSKRLRVQVEEGSYPTSYIPTTGSAVVRNADHITLINDSFNTVTGDGTIITESLGTGSSPIWDFKEKFFGNHYRLFWLGQNGRFQMSPDYGRSVADYPDQPTEGFIKFGVTFTAAKYSKFRNGVNTFNDATLDGGHYTNRDAMRIGALQGSSELRYLNGHVKSLIYYPVALPYTQMIQLTRND